MLDDSSGHFDKIGRAALNKFLWQGSCVHEAQRSGALGQQPCCAWRTGLSGAGKSTLANALATVLHPAGRHVYVLGGDNIGEALHRYLGFNAEDRKEDIRPVAEVAHLMVDAGQFVLVAFISCFRAGRDMARAPFTPGPFVEVFIDAAPLTCEQRDTKGLYAKARSGEPRELAAVDSPYEPPLTPEVHVRADRESLAECIAKIRGVP